MKVTAYTEQELSREGPGQTPNTGSPVLVEPDLDFIRTLDRRSGATLKKCFQCGACSATCEISSAVDPFPRQEMAWATWGMRERLLRDPQVWLCHQCNDCSTNCPRGARPGNVMAAIRRECIEHYAMPHFLGRWVNRPRFIPLLLGIAITLLALALGVKERLADALGLSQLADDQIIYSYSSLFPHWLLNGFFAFFSLLALLAILVGVGRFWRAMSEDGPLARLG
jgi:quinone-modifying oxidoreductase subunit QmoC